RLPRLVPFLARWNRSNANGRDDHIADGAVRRQLTARCDEVGRQLGRSGLRTRRLDAMALAHLFHRCWASDLARRQRFRQEIDLYTTVVVGGTRQVRHTGSVRRATQPEARESMDLEADRDGETETRSLSHDERLLALGSRTLADLVAPGGCEIRRDHLRFE